MEGTKGTSQLTVMQDLELAPGLEPWIPYCINIKFPGVGTSIVLL